MTTSAIVVFFVSLVGILLLFLIKRLEFGRERRALDGIRTTADNGALRVKALLELSESTLEKTPYFLAALARYGVHIAALAFARLARKSAESAHSLADLVSHKHRFERKETKSQFLKEVSGYKEKHTDDSGVATM